MLETSASESLHGGQFTLSIQLIKPNYLVILPPMQHHSFFRNLPPLWLWYNVMLQYTTQHVGCQCCAQHGDFIQYLEQTLSITMQLRYIRTKYMRTCQYAYTYYMRVSLNVSLLCIPISFSMWSIVGQTRHIYGNEKDFKAKFAYC